MREFLGTTTGVLGYAATALGTGAGTLATWDRSKEAQNEWMDVIMANSQEGTQDFWGIAAALVMSAVVCFVIGGVGVAATNSAARAVTGAEK